MAGLGGQVVPEGEAEAPRVGGLARAHAVQQLDVAQLGPAALLDVEAGAQAGGVVAAQRLAQRGQTVPVGVVQAQHPAHREVAHQAGEPVRVGAGGLGQFGHGPQT